MKTYALIGSSGTGKSYKALNLAHAKDIQYIIDDGILIHKNKILAGSSAKKANTKMEAVRIAIFEDEDKSFEIKKCLKDHKVDKLLIIGTSKKMINIIMQRLDIDELEEEISINDISTAKEIAEAKKNRREKGIHVVPLPTFEVKKHFYGLFIDSMKSILKSKNRVDEEIEKTIIRPTFSCFGKYYISEKAIKQIIIYELLEFKEVKNISSINIKYDKTELKIKIDIELSMCNIIGKSLKIQTKIHQILANMTLLNISQIDIFISRIYL